jgi:L-ribulose-5-phosphate 3-epimerase
LKKGINIWSFKNDMTLKDCILTAKKTGFDGIELALGEEGEVRLDSTNTELLEIKKFAKETAIELPSVATGLYWKYPLTSLNESVRQKAKDIVKRQLEIASIFNSDTILVLPGLVGEDFSPGGKPVSYDKAYDFALEAFSELKAEAEKAKISIGIENVWNKFLLSPLEMRDFIDKIDSQYVSSYFDVGNVLINGYPEQWIRILGKRIKKLHFKDFKCSVGNISGFVDLLVGDVNYPEVVKALQEIDYNDYTIGEIGSYNYHSSQVIVNTFNSMKIILGE